MNTYTEDFNKLKQKVKKITSRVPLTDGQLKLLIDYVNKFTNFGKKSSK
jgi:hypothetical protein